MSNIDVGMVLQEETSVGVIRPGSCATLLQPSRRPLVRASAPAVSSSVTPLPSTSDYPSVDYEHGLLDRLKDVRRQVQTGEASLETRALWRELQEAVMSLVEGLRLLPGGVSDAQALQAIRACVIDFTDRHWPNMTLH